MVGDTGTTRTVLPPDWEPVVHDDSVAVQRGFDGVVLQAKSKKDPDQIHTCVEVIEPARLERTYVTGGQGKSLVVVEAWPGDEAWATDVTAVVAEALPTLEAMLGTPMPYGELRVREVATQSRRYSSGDLRPTDGVLGIDEDADARSFLASGLVRAWIDPEQIADPWLAEGFATWLSTLALADMTCGDATDHPGPDAPDLDAWIEAGSAEAMPLVDWQWVTACRLVEAGAAVIGDEAMVELIADLIDAPVPVGTSHWLAGVSRDMSDGLDSLVAALDAAGVDH